ncbi:DUF7285 family protein [Halobacterium zhouii]|uniref:DUF7285 family protein n=1 Tax=Halobacterium zhouii TaxID=2902624 RepID=UPI001E341C55|nr:hypothetical protein [Halobacterium zhouii]
MSRSSARRAQVEPLPALAAVAVVCLAVGAYGAVRLDVLPESENGAPAEQVLVDAVDAATADGDVVVDPSRLESQAVTPRGYAVAVTVTASGREWTAGASNPPSGAATASRPVPIRTRSGRVVPGRFVVEVWA